MAKHKVKWILLGFVLGIVTTILSGMLIFGPVRQFDEFAMAENVKGYWASLQDFERKNGRYPKDAAEINAFFHTSTETEPVDYVPPQGTNDEEVILWWKKKTIFGSTVGITKGGMIVKN